MSSRWYADARRQYDKNPIGSVFLKEYWAIFMQKKAAAAYERESVSRETPALEGSTEELR